MRVITYLGKTKVILVIQSANILVSSVFSCFIASLPACFEVGAGQIVVAAGQLNKLSDANFAHLFGTNG